MRTFSFHLVYYNMYLFFFKGGAFPTGEHSYGRPADLDSEFQNENFILNHTGFGFVSMARVGKFSITHVIINLFEILFSQRNILKYILVTGIVAK